MSGAGMATAYSKNVADNATNYLTGLGGLTLADGTGFATNYYLAAGETAVAHINPATLTATVTAPNKIYNGNTTAAATLSITGGLLNGETLNVDGSATFNSKDVVTANLVTVNSIALSDGTGLASNYHLSAGETITAHITPAPLYYTATPASVYSGQMPSGLSGTVQGLVPGDALNNATSGTLSWTTLVNAASNPGLYAINGGGLVASNYVFSQAAGNASALTLKPVQPNLVLNPVVVVSESCANAASVSTENQASGNCSAAATIAIRKSNPGLRPDLSRAD